jgi:hypothetical protein
MIAESMVVLSTYWPQSISVSDPVHTETRTSWLITSNNAVQIHFNNKARNAKLSGYGSVSGRSIMPADDGTFTVSIDKDTDMIMVVSADEKK